MALSWQTRGAAFSPASPIEPAVPPRGSSRDAFPRRCPFKSPPNPAAALRSSPPLRPHPPARRRANRGPLPPGGAPIQALHEGHRWAGGGGGGRSDERRHREPIVPGGKPRGGKPAAGSANGGAEAQSGGRSQFALDRRAAARSAARDGGGGGGRCCLGGASREVSACPPPSPPPGAAGRSLRGWDPHGAGGKGPAPVPSGARPTRAALGGRCPPGRCLARARAPSPPGGERKRLSPIVPVYSPPFSSRGAMSSRQTGFFPAWMMVLASGGGCFLRLL